MGFRPTSAENLTVRIGPHAAAHSTTPSGTPAVRLVIPWWAAERAGGSPGQRLLRHRRPSLTTTAPHSTLATGFLAAALVRLGTRFSWSSVRRNAWRR